MDMSMEKCGIIMSCYGLGSVSGAFVGGVLTDRIGYYKVMLVSLFMTSLAFLVVMQLTEFLPLCLGFFGISFIADTFRPANITAIEAFSKKQNLTRSIGLIRLAINLGYAFGPFFGGYIAAQMGYNYLFLFNGLSVFLAGITFYYFFRNKKKALQEEKAAIRTQEKVDVQMPWRDGSYLAYLTLFGLTVIVFFQLIYIVPLYYKTELGFDESMVGLMMGLNGLLIFLIEMPLIFKIERFYNPVSLVVLGGLLIGAGVVSLAIFQQPYVAALTFMVLITFGEILSFPFSNTFALEFANDLNRGKYMGFYTMTFSLAHVVAPIAWFKFAEWNGYDMTWYCGALICLLASLAIFQFRGKTVRA